MQETNDILIYDGECNFCSASVDFVLRFEKDRDLRFMWIQSSRSSRIMSEHNISSSVDSIILISNGEAHIRSSAALRIAKHLKWPFNWLRVFLFVPRPLRDLVYNFVAKNRKKIMGSTSCALPIGIEDRFIS